MYAAYVRWAIPLACVSFSCGIALRALDILGVAGALLLVLVAGIVALYGYWHTRASHILFVGVLVVCGAVALGVLRMHTAIPAEAAIVPAEEVTLTGSVVAEPDARGTYTNFILASNELPQRVLVRTDATVEVFYNDTVRVTGVLEAPENFEGDTGRIFNYQGYLAKDNIYAIMAFPRDVQITRGPHSILGTLLTLKQHYLSSLKRALSEPYAALAGGITVGERRSLGGELTDEFRRTGLIHIIVLSGYNVAIIVLFIAVLLRPLPDRVRYSIALLSIALFVLLVGAGAPVVRAGLMGGIAVIGTMAHRTYSALHALFLTALGMLVVNPYILMYDPSFQLSVIATLGLLLGTPRLLPSLSFIPDSLGMRELAAVTIATQIAVTPWLLYLMGQFSTVALAVNMIVLPMIPLAMLAVFIVGIVGAFSLSLVVPFAALAHVLLSYVLLVVHYFAELPFAEITVPQFPLWVVAIAYAVLSVVILAPSRSVPQRSPSSYW